MQYYREQIRNRREKKEALRRRSYEERWNDKK